MILQIINYFQLSKILCFITILLYPFTETYPFSVSFDNTSITSDVLMIKNSTIFKIYLKKNKYNEEGQRTGDYYIDRLTGKLLGRDRSNSSELRVIDKREWVYVKKEKGGIKSREGIRELHKNSFLLNFDENQIQKEIQSLADNTAQEELEHQLYIVLDVNTGKIYAKRELSPNKILRTKSIIETYEIGKRSAPRVAEGLMLLAEVHGHPKTINRSEINIKSASKIDRQAAKDLGVNIFVVDAFDDSQNVNFPRAIHRVNKRGRLKKYVGQTTGKKGINTFNFTKYFTDILKRNKL